MLELKKIRKVYRNAEKTEALRGIDLVLPDRGLVFILGKSGCGKTTLLNIIGGLDSPTEGAIFYNDGMLPRQKEWLQKVGYVFQNIYLFPFLTAEENIAAAQAFARKNEAEPAEYLRAVEMEEAQKRKARLLSGGEQQRVAIARMLAKDASIVLADEPTGSLDEESAERVFRILQEIAKERLVVVVTHDEESACAYAERLIRMEDGKIVSDEAREAPVREAPVIRRQKGAPPKGHSFAFAMAQIGRNKFKSALYCIGLAIILMLALLFPTAYDIDVATVTWKFWQKDKADWAEIANQYSQDKKYNGQVFAREEYTYLKANSEGFYSGVCILYDGKAIEQACGACESYAELGLTMLSGVPNGDVLVSDAYALKHGVGVGDTVEVFNASPDPENMEILQGVVGGIVDTSVFEDRGASIFPDILTTEDYLARNGYVIDVSWAPSRWVIFYGSIGEEAFMHILRDFPAEITQIKYCSGSRADTGQMIAQEIENGLIAVRTLLMSVGIAVAAMMVGFTILFVSLSVTDNKRETGVLKTLGARTWDLVKIFVCQFLLLYAAAVALGLLLFWGATALLTQQFIEYKDVLEQGVVYFGVNIWHLAALGAATGVEVCAVFLPLVRLHRLPLNRLMRSL